MPKVLKIILYIFLGLILLGVIGRLLGVEPDKPTASVPIPSETPEQAKARLDSTLKADAKAIKDNTMTADNLVGYYKQNEVKADNELKDKEFYVSGRIESIGKDMMNDIYITLKSSDPIRNVQCFIDDANLVAELQKGQKVLVKGKCSGLMMNVIMKECQVIEK